MEACCRRAVWFSIHARKGASRSPPRRCRCGATHCETVQTWPPVVALVHSFEAETFEERGIAAGGVDDKAREPSRRLRVGTDRHHSGAALSTELDLGHACALNNNRSKPAAIVEQQLVEGGTLNVIAMINAQKWVAIKSERRRLSMLYTPIRLISSAIPKRSNSSRLRVAAILRYGIGGSDLFQVRRCAYPFAPVEWR